MAQGADQADAREKGSGVDLIRDFATPLPVFVLTDLLGIPASDRIQVQRWGRDLASGLDPAIRAQSVARAGAAATAMVEYMLGQIDAARGLAGGHADRSAREQAYQVDDLGPDRRPLSLPGHGCRDGVGLDRQCLAGPASKPDELDKIRREPLALDTGIDELIRFDGPLHLTARVATEDVEVAGVKIRSG